MTTRRGIEPFELQQAVINNKQDLYNYLVDDFGKLFFTEKKYVQEQLKIVGPVRFRTIHTIETQCKLQTQLNKCFAQTMNDATYLKTTISGVPFTTCEENGISHTISGENAPFPCDGHKIDVYPSEVDPSSFKEVLDSRMEMLFGDSARGMNIDMTLYLPRANWWVHVQVLYEYAVQGQQVFNRPTSNYQTFRLNIYQLSSDTATLVEQGVVVEAYGYFLFWFDLIKLILYSLYFGKQQINDVKFFLKRYYMAGLGEVFSVVWNATVTFMNLANFILFVNLSRNYNVNNMLRSTEFIDSYAIMSKY